MKELILTSLFKFLASQILFSISSVTSKVLEMFIKRITGIGKNGKPLLMMGINTEKFIYSSKLYEVLYSCIKPKNSSNDSVR